MISRARSSGIASLLRLSSTGSQPTEASRARQMPMPWLVGLRSDDEVSPCPVVNATFDFRDSRSRIRADVIASSPLKTDSKRSAQVEGRVHDGTWRNLIVG